MSVTFEDAKRCPRCDNPGEDTRQMPGQDGSTVHIITCRNERCSWFDTNWMIQVKEDGTIPIRDSGGSKQFPAMPGMSKERADAEVNAILDDQ